MPKFFPSFEGSTTKELILEVLAEQWPLTGVKIFRIVNKRLPKPITQQALHKTLSQLVELGLIIKKNREYELNSKWLLETLEFCHNTLESYEGKKPKKISKSLVRIKILQSPDFYKAERRCIQTTKEIRICARTPIFLEEEQQKTIFRRKLFDTLSRVIASDKVSIKYILSSDLTKKILLEKQDNKALILLKRLIQKPNFRLKCADSSKMTPMVLTDKDFFYGIKSPLSNHCIGWIQITGARINEIKEIYDAIFENLPNAYNLIKEIEAELK